MEEEHIKKHLNRPDRHFEFHDKVTYIEHQEITVQSGATFNNGPQAGGEVVKEESLDNITQIPESTDNTQNNSKSKIERIFNGVNAVYNSGFIEHDYEYAAIYKAIDEEDIFDKFSFQEFIDLLSDTGIFKKEELPSSSTICKVIIKGKYPEWKVTDKGYNVTKKIVKIGKCFFDAYNKK